MMTAFQVRASFWLALPVLGWFVLERIDLAAAQTPAAEGAAPAAEPASRYPFDPACPWGRIADGRGLLVRCLERSEARALLANSAAPPNGAPAPSRIATPNGAPASSGASAASASPALARPAPAAPRRRVVLKEVGPAQADTGELPEARAQLSRAAERYVACVENNGGVEGSLGKVTMRFLVRERGRAEGVAVKERRGISLAAAKCVAEVVDRRFVGYPAAPIVGATLSIEFESAPR